MKFCPRCGTLMVVKRGENGLSYVCPKCGYTETPGSSTTGRTVKLLATTIKHSEKEKIIVVDQNLEERMLPKTRIQCPRCGHDEAYYWVVQTRRADEPPTRFYKCVKCGYVWREYD